MFDNPILQFTLGRTARRPRLYLARVLWLTSLLSLATTIVLVTRGTLSGVGEPEVARSVFALTFTLQTLGLMAVCPVWAGSAFPEARQRRILPFLLDSPMPSLTITIGMLFSGLAPTVALILATWPVLTLLSLLGGIDPLELLALVWLNLSTAFLLSSVCLLVGMGYTNPHRAILACLVLEAAWLLVFPILSLLGPAWLVESPFATVLAWADLRPLFDPLELLDSRDGRGLNALLFSGGSQAALGILCMIAATLRVRRMSADSARGNRQAARLPGVTRHRSARGERRLDDSPLFWKDTRVPGMARRLRRWAWRIVEVGFIFAWIGPLTLEHLTCRLGTSSGATSLADLRADFQFHLVILSLFLGLVSQIVVTVSAATSITSERERETWVSLLAFPWDARDILIPKWSAALWNGRWYFVWFLLILTIGVALGGLSPLPALLAAIALPVYLGFAAAFGLSCSTDLQASWRAVAIPLLWLFLWNLASIICCAFGFVDSLAPGAGLLVLQLISPIGNLGMTLAMDHFHDRAFTILGACLFGILAYGTATLLMLRSTLEQFDDKAGRPQRPAVTSHSQSTT
jgi:ABC-type transport system involved in multi-copper enzyme maturation permease subunit